MSQQFLINDQGEVIGIDCIERIINALNVITIYFNDGTNAAYTYPAGQADVVMAGYQKVFATLGNGKTLFEMIPPTEIALIAGTSLILTSVTAATGNPGDVVDLVGSGFLNLGPISLMFDDAPVDSIIVNSDTSAQCIVPPHASGVVDVILTATDLGTSNTLVNGFTYL